MPGREDGRTGRQPVGGPAASGREPTARDTPAAGGARETTGRARPVSSRDRGADRVSTQQRRPSTARRQARSGRRATVRTIRMHGLLGLSSTRRAAVLALVVCALVLSVAVPLRNYLAQRGALEDTMQQQDTLRRQVDELERRRTQLQDPAQVEVEARERLRYVRPGETPYVVQLPTATPAPAPAQEQPAPQEEEQRWYGQMWESIAGQDGD